VLTHVLGIFFGLISALVMFLLYRDRGPFVRAHTVTEWNFQLTTTIFSAVGFVLAFASVVGSIVTSATSGGGAPPSIWLFFIGYFSIVAVRAVATVFGISASVKANQGQFYWYPIAIRFVK
jgi:Uncharacterized protein conserved in bacteria